MIVYFATALDIFINASSHIVYRKITQNAKRFKENGDIFDNIVVHVNPLNPFSFQIEI